MEIVCCWQTIPMKYHTLFFRKLGEMSQNLSSAAVVIGALRVKFDYSFFTSRRCQRNPIIPVCLTKSTAGTSKVFFNERISFI